MHWNRVERSVRACVESRLRISSRAKESPGGKKRARSGIIRAPSERQRSATRNRFHERVSIGLIKFDIPLSRARLNIQYKCRTCSWRSPNCAVVSARGKSIDPRVRLAAKIHFSATNRGIDVLRSNLARILEEAANSPRTREAVHSGIPLHVPVDPATPPSLVTNPGKMQLQALRYPRI